MTLSGNNNSLEKMRRRRIRYIHKLSRNIFQGSTTKQVLAYASPQGLSPQNDSTLGGTGLVYQTGPANGDSVTSQMKRVQDALSSQLYKDPSSDMLAFSRRIENPQVFRHAPVYGF